MKKCLILLMLMASALTWAQSTTNVSLNVTDADGQIWWSGTWSAQLVPPAGGPQAFGPPWFALGTTTQLTGSQIQSNGSLDTNGNATFSLVSNTSIAPANSQWLLTVCPLATTPSCYTQRVTVTGVSQTINLVPSGIRVSFVQPQYKVQLYQDIEATGMTAGQTYWNLTSLVQKIYNGSAWIVGAGINGLVNSYTTTTLPSSSNTEGTLANLTNGPQGLYWYKNGWWHPLLASLNIQDFGARGDGGTYSNVGCTSGSATISNVAATYGRLPKAGDTMVVSGCGVAGADLQCVLSAGPGTPFSTATCGGGVTAGATLSSRGAYWSTSITADNTAFTNAITYCTTSTTLPPGGCEIDVPSGVYFVSNQTFPAIQSGPGGGAAYGRIKIKGMGRGSSVIVGIGADQSAVFTAPANSVPTALNQLTFVSYDYNNKTQWATQWLGGTEHDFSDNFVTNMYGMVNAANTWIDWITHNRCYVVKGSCVEFGGAAGTGPVNEAYVQHNEFANWGTTGHAIYTHTNNSSYGNYYGPNGLEDSNPPFGSAIYLSDNTSVLQEGYNEISNQTGVYIYEIHGAGNSIYSQGLPCTYNSGGNVFYAPGIGSSYPCVGQAYYIFNAGAGSKYYGIPPEFASSIGNADQFIGGVGSVGSGSILNSLHSYQYAIGTVMDWSLGRVDIAGTPMGRSQATGNPSYPNQFGTAATIPQGTLIANSSLAYSSGSGPTINGNMWWICNTNPCTTNPFVASQWTRIGERHNRLHVETTYPNYNGYAIASQQGDIFYSVVPNTWKGVYGWVTTTAGTPGIYYPLATAGNLGFQNRTTAATMTFDPSGPAGGSAAGDSYGVGGNFFKVTLSMNVTSSTMQNGIAGQIYLFEICENATGGFTFAFPTSFKGVGVLNTLPTVCNYQAFSYDGTNYTAITPMIDWAGNINAPIVNATNSLQTNGTAVVDSVQNITALKYKTQGQCASAASPAACSNFPAGFVTIAAGATTITVNTSAVSATSQIFVQEDDTQGTALGVTCNTAGNRNYEITARAAATSFQITANAAPATNPACLAYYIIN